MPYKSPMGLFNKKPKEHTGPVGGLVFFTSLVLLWFVGTVNILSQISLIELGSVGRWGAFAGAGILGFFITLAAAPSKFCVFIHEMKHSIISNLAGNKAKSMKVEDESGSFRYEFTRDTAAYNAFISLAPYWVPLFTVIAILSTLPFFSLSSWQTLAIVSFCYGVDCMMNARDISPYQTDFSNLRGGYRVGLIYVFGMNLALFSLLAVWVSAGEKGFITLGQLWWEGGLWVVHKIRGVS